MKRNRCFCDCKLEEGGSQENFDFSAFVTSRCFLFLFWWCLVASADKNEAKAMTLLEISAKAKFSVWLSCEVVDVNMASAGKD